MFSASAPALLFQMQTASLGSEIATADCLIDLGSWSLLLREASEHRAKYSVSRSSLREVFGIHNMACVQCQIVENDKVRCMYGVVLPTPRSLVPYTHTF